MAAAEEDFDFKSWLDEAHINRKTESVLEREELSVLPALLLIDQDTVDELNLTKGQGLALTQGVKKLNQKYGGTILETGYTGKGNDFEFEEWLDDSHLTRKTQRILEEEDLSTFYELTLLDQQTINGLKLSKGQTILLQWAVQNLQGKGEEKKEGLTKKKAEAKAGEKIEKDRKLGLEKLAPNTDSPNAGMLIKEAKEIKDMLKQGIPRKPNLNILLLGSPGAGKSSLINSMIAALDERGYRELATTGEGGGEQEAAITPGLEQIPLFDAKESGYECKPVFWDYPGLMNEDVKEVIRKVLSGQVKPGTALGKVRQVKATETALPDMNERIHLILYVHAYHVPPNQQLLESLIGLTRTTDTTKYVTPTMLVMTNADKAITPAKEIQEALNEAKAEKRKITKEAVIDQLRRKKTEDAVNAVANYLKMKNQFARIAVVSCYSSETAGDEGRDPTGQRRHELDKELCKLWKKIAQEHYYRNFEAK